MRREQRLARLCHKHAALVYFQRLEVFQIDGEKDVRLPAFFQNAAVEFVMFRGRERCHAHRVRRAHARPHRRGDDVVYMSEVEYVRRMAVVRAEGKTPDVILVHRRQYVEKLFARAALANEHVHARRQLVARLVRAAALVIGSHALSGVSGKFQAAAQGKMSVYGFARPARRRQLCQHVRVARRHAGIIHHFAKTEDVFAFERVFHRLRVQHRAAALRRRSGHAGRHHHLHFQRRGSGVFYHKVHAVHAAHVGYLVRIGNDGGGAAWHDRLGKARRRELAALYVHVRVDKPGQRIKSAHVFSRAQVRAHGGDQPVFDGDVRFFHLAAAHVEQAAIFEHFIKNFHKDIIAYKKYNCNSAIAIPPSYAILYM